MKQTIGFMQLMALALIFSVAGPSPRCHADVKSDFVAPPPHLRSRPLWFWNNTAVSASGVEEQLLDSRDKGGYGGLAPLPFGPEFTPKYLSEEYFELYGVAVKKARELGMFITLYDEYGFPSGSGGANMGDGIPRFAIKYPDATLRRLDKHEDEVTGPASYHQPLPAGTLMSLVAMNTDTKQRVDLTRMVSGGAIDWDVPAGVWKIMTFVCVLDGDPNVDYLDHERCAKFVAMVYQPYYDKFGKDFGATIGGIPLLGHQDQENVKNPVGISGDLMKSYRYQDVPGIDKIGWENDPEGYYKVVSSASNNWDKAQVMTETYGAMGNLSWDRLYAIVMEQYAKGINNFVPHGVWYNLDNITYLPELSHRNPLYAAGLKEYNTYIARLNVLLQTPGRHVADIALLYPISTLQAGFRFDGPLGPNSGGVSIPEADYIHLGELLSTRVCRDFTYLHPDTLDERCAVHGDLLKLTNPINFEQYKVVILPGHKTIRWSNLKKIREFYEQGGKVIATGQLPDKSAEFGHDADVVAAIQAMFPTVRHHDRHSQDRHVPADHRLPCPPADQRRFFWQAGHQRIRSLPG